MPRRWPEQPPPPPIVKVNDVLPLPLPALPVAVAVTLNAPAVVGVPEIRPVVALMDRPVGRPVAVQVSAPPLIWNLTEEIHKEASA